MPVKQYQIKELRSFKVFVEPKYKQYLDDLVKLYQERKIPTYPTAYKIAKGLSRHTGTPMAAVRLMQKYYNAPMAKDRNKALAEANLMKTYFIKGKVQTSTQYAKTTNKGTKVYDKNTKMNFRMQKRSGQHL
jgi:hypothetical protein